MWLMKVCDTGTITSYRSFLTFACNLICSWDLFVENLIEIYPSAQKIWDRFKVTSLFSYECI